MAQATNPLTRFHSLSSAALADAFGHADAVLKSAEAECKALKDEFKARGLIEATGEDSPSGFGENFSPARYYGHEGLPRRLMAATASTIIRVKAAKPLAVAA